MSADLVQRLQEIADWVEALSEREVYLRNTWDGVLREHRRLIDIARDNESLKCLSGFTNLIWEIQDTRGIKSKEKVRQKILKHLSESISRARQIPQQSP